MSSTTDKIKGYANEAAGNVKQVVGKVVGSPELEAEGVVQERYGEAQQAAADVKGVVEKATDAVTNSSTVDKAKGYANQAIGKAKEVIGNVGGSERIEAEGVAQQAKGEAQKVVGDVKWSVGR